MAGRFCSPKGKKGEISFMLEGTLRATQYNTKCGRKVLEEWQQRRQNKWAMSELVGVDGLKCEDVQSLTVSLEHKSPSTLYFWLSKFVCEVTNQNGECYPPNSLYLLICVVNCHLCETGEEDALNVLNKAEKRQVNCYVILVID